MRPRTLRCANFVFYQGTVLLVLAACAYVLTRRPEPLQLGAAVAGIIVALAWGGAYLRLRYRVDAEGIERRTLRGTQRLRWADCTAAELLDIQTPGEESRTLVLHTAAGPAMRISSDQLSLEAVEELEQDLRTLGIPFQG